METATQTLQSRLLLEMQKKNREQAQQINELESDIEFLKKALAIALKDHGRNAIRMTDEYTSPEFKLEENISGEIIVRLIHI